MDAPVCSFILQATSFCLDGCEWDDDEHDTGDPKGQGEGAVPGRFTMKVVETRYGDGSTGESALECAAPNDGVEHFPFFVTDADLHDGAGICLYTMWRYSLRFIY